MWLAFEWLGALVALMGSGIIASKRLAPYWGWSAWIMSNLLLLSLFVISTEQYGFALMQFVGLIVNIAGLYQWWKKTEEINSYLKNGLFLFSVVASLLGIFYLCSYFSSVNSAMLQWAAAWWGIAATVLLASRHKLAPYCWYLWLLSNGLIVGVCLLFTGQKGILALNIGFFLINIYGVFNWRQAKN